MTSSTCEAPLNFVRSLEREKERERLSRRRLRGTHKYRKIKRGMFVNEPDIYGINAAIIRRTFRRTYRKALGQLLCLWTFKLTMIVLSAASRLDFSPEDSLVSVSYIQ